ncbi:MAG: phosphatase, partial [Parachlamydiaceae bacterium]
DIDLSKLQAKGVIGRPHIAALLIEKGVVKDIKEAFTKYLGEGKAGYVEAFTITLEETLAVIKKAGGVSILAHPHLLSESSLFNRLVKYPFDGVECYYGNFTMQQNERYLKKAIEKNLLVTGGSDFHGFAKPLVRYGSSYVNHENFLKLMIKRKVLLAEKQSP